MRVQHTEVLVVGAGPVGMFTALLLARQGVKVQIIDQAPGTAAHSYACALHARTVRLLEKAGVPENVFQNTRRMERIAFYDGVLRRAEIPFASITPDVPYVLVLPQNELEAELELALREHEIHVGWNRRLGDLARENNGVVATVDELCGTATGYDVPRWEMTVRRTGEVAADFIVGCDGRASAVKQAMAITDEVLGEPEQFVVYEFESDIELPSEIRVVLNISDVNVLWPLSNGRCRWGFQWTDTEGDGEFPPKERNRLWFEEKPVAQRTHEHLAHLIRERAPWFTGRIDEMHWAADVQFQPQLAAQFGRDRGWLAGDAAHQTGPVGVQSMNVGFVEAEMLSHGIAGMLRGPARVAELEAYDEAARAEWQRLLGLTTEVAWLDQSRFPVLRQAKRLLPCLPASGNELDAMLTYLGFTLRSFSPPTVARR